MDNRSIINYWKLGCLNITVDSRKSPTYSASFGVSETELGEKRHGPI